VYTGDRASYRRIVVCARDCAREYAVVQLWSLRNTISISTVVSEQLVINHSKACRELRK
jgi:hypothetical protein